MCSSWYEDFRNWGITFILRNTFSFVIRWCLPWRNQLAGVYLFWIWIPWYHGPKRTVCLFWTPNDHAVDIHHAISNLYREREREREREFIAYQYISTSLGSLLISHKYLQSRKCSDFHWELHVHCIKLVRQQKRVYSQEKKKKWK